MTINEFIEQIGGRERLEEISKFHSGMIFPPSHDEIELMGRALLAVLDAKQVGITDNAEIECLLRGETANVMPPNYRGVDKGGEVYIYATPPVASVPDALREAVNAIYFTDSSDYFSALWSIVRFLSPETADLLAKDECAAFERVNANLQHAAAPVPGGDAE
ncbi:hypothetical protein JNO12_12605 [Erwinia aphidicola]|nr:hypothetical protein [Erwinia aphidicola]